MRTGRVPRVGFPWKQATERHENYVFKHYSMVHLYAIMSYGRRMYRTLWFSNDCRYTLRELTPSAGSRMMPMPPLFRYAAGDAEHVSASDRSGCVLLRD